MRTNTNQQDQPAASPAWFAIITALAAVAVVVAGQFRIVPLSWWAMPLGAIGGLGVTFLVTVFQELDRGGHGWLRLFTYRSLVWLAAGTWTTWTFVAGWSGTLVLCLLAGTAALAAFGAVCPTPRADYGDDDRQPPPGDRRPPVLREWEARIRTVTRLPVVVTRWEPWRNRDDGMRLFVELPAELGTTTADLAAAADKLAAAARLPRGCAVRVLDADRQGVAVVDVMLRNCLTDNGRPYREATTAASINDDFPVLTTPRGELLSICLRIMSMVVGGTTGSGKTTFLHRIIMWLARCTDALVWVVDLNGGGVAEPWISPWANGRTSAPVVDWVADSEEEAAVMAAVAGAIARDRKTNSEAVRRKRAANDMVLPVDARMPAIVVLTDEGGEVRQATSLLGQLAANGITRLAQIGRAEAVRVIMSVLRGTSDLTDKGLRVNAGLRLCLRMEEHDEYAHVLGANPGKTELSGAGAGFLRTPTNPRPVLGRTVNVDLRGIDAHAVACGPLRPGLDEWALRAAAKVTGGDVFGGKQPPDEALLLPQIRDANGGRAYTARWDRYAAKLAEMRGEVYVPTALADADAPASLPVGATRAAPTINDADLDALEAAAGTTSATVYQFPHQQQPAEEATTARGQILGLIEAAGAEGISAAAIERAVNTARSRVYELLRQLTEQGHVTKNGAGLYVAAQVRQEATTVG